jgi:pilus assembly protein CpaC
MISSLKKTTAIAALLLASWAGTANAQVTTVSNPALNDKVILDISQGPVSGSIDVADGKSRVLKFDRAIGHTLIANPAIADLIPMTDQSIYILGKSKGTTSLTLFDKDQTLLGVFDLNVTSDIASLKQRLYQLAPDENIQVRTHGDSIILSGEVSGSDIAQMASDMAEQIAPGKVLNTITIPKSQQVMLRVKIAEVQRSVSKQLGLSTNAFFNSGPDSLNFFSGVVDPEAYASLVGNFRIGDVRLQMLLEALEEQGVLSTLAEPTLVAISGETANFLAGGEFPIPVANNVSDGGDDDDSATTARVTVQFKEFGVKLAYTPTVVGDTIHLVIKPEVSVLDPANGVVLNNISIPALVTRRAETTVELKNGQSFAIAGLLQETFEDSVQQIPGIGKIPIIGALARSTSYQKSESELVIIVTPYIVEPHEGSNIALPTDNFIKPTEGELFFEGDVEGEIANNGSYYSSNPGTTVAANQGTTDGEVGYIVK